MPFADDPAISRRVVALRSLLVGGGVAVRPSLSVGFQANRSRFGPSGRQVLQPVAVSYTHLDVYKRQILADAD